MSVLSRALTCEQKETDYPKGAQVGGMLLAADVHLQVVHPEDCHLTQQASKTINFVLLLFSLPASRRKFSLFFIHQQHDL
jgi:hypothetical protein